MFGHWNVTNTNTLDIKNYEAFVYEAICNESPHRYIGFKKLRSIHNVESDWKTYTTSSDVVEQMLADGYTFTYTILEFFTTAVGAYAYERQLLIEHQVTQSDIWLNKSNGGGSHNSGHTGAANGHHKGFWQTPAGIFESTVAAAKYHGVKPSTIMRRCKATHRLPDWKFIPGLSDAAKAKQQHAKMKNAKAVERLHKKVSMWKALIAKRNAKRVLDLDTMIVYKHKAQCADTLGLSRSTVGFQCANKRLRTQRFIYYAPTQALTQAQTQAQPLL